MLRQMINVAAAESEISADSAGLSAYHIGDSPDSRAQKAALARGYNISAQRARLFEIDDYQKFDLILAMDRGHLEKLQRRQPQGSKAVIKLFLSYAPEFGDEVPDPYYDGPQAFASAADMIETGCQNLMKELLGRDYP